MYRQFRSILLGAALSAFAGAFVTNAQNLRVTADVPFAFHTQGPVLSSGKVMVKEVNGQGLYSITDNTGESTFWNASRKIESDPQKPHLTFACYGHDCVLSEVAMAGSSTAFKVSEKSIEQQLPHKIGLATMIRVPLR